MRRWSLLFLGLPAVLCSWLSVLSVRLFFGGSLKWEDGRVLTLELPKGKGPFGRYSVTLGYGVIYASGTRSKGRTWGIVQRHEHVHVKQFEGWCVAGAAAGLAVAFLSEDFAAALAVWASMPVFVWFGYSFGSWLRGGTLYLDAVHEEAARAISESGKAR